MKPMNSPITRRFFIGSSAALTATAVSPSLSSSENVSASATVSPERDCSGAWYDWTKTLQPETPWRHDYNKTLVTKIFLCSRTGAGDVDQVFLKFGDVPEVLRKLDNLTLGIPKIAYLVGWQYNGHDSKYPAWAEVNQHLKRDEDATALDSLKWLVQEAKRYNTTISLHINMIDAFEDSPLWQEYLEKDIVAKDKQGNPIKGELFANMQSYQISYAQEWKLGYAQKRIDGLLAMLPELRESGTIHIDAFHSMRPSGPNEPISPYLGIPLEDEIATQRKIIRYFQQRGLDVTSEGYMYGLRKDPFIGLQAMVWHLDEDSLRDLEWIGKPKAYSTLPAQFAAYSPMQCEGEIGKDPVNLTGLREQVCLRLVPWYYKRNADVSKTSDVILTRDKVVCPVLWKDRALIAYSGEKDDSLDFRIPSTWGKVQELRTLELTPEGLKPITLIKVSEQTVRLNIPRGVPVVIMP